MGQQHLIQHCISAVQEVPFWVKKNRLGKKTGGYPLYNLCVSVLRWILQCIILSKGDKTHWYRAKCTMHVLSFWRCANLELDTIPNELLAMHIVERRPKIYLHWTCKKNSVDQADDEFLTTLRGTRLLTAEAVFLFLGICRMRSFFQFWSKSLCTELDS